ncbi:DEAD-domain-containing protein [Gonapodya prolifera JEL478]|uniref:RNA helicase n=1 Tax=Gonapodya prolifera (strain JEL478) TaxID=1344416 RepID=A0A139AU18_GONPJ|nr:DEAD-domain-containing protein [Gonapodya prolifera JEL478]|eukprot:KXS20208.1 DEAD-domain-containing protein [Gonapodya prolifera JEL478]
MIGIAQRLARAGARSSVAPLWNLRSPALLTVRTATMMRRGREPAEDVEGGELDIEFTSASLGRQRGGRLQKIDELETIHIGVQTSSSLYPVPISEKTATVLSEKMGIKTLFPVQVESFEPVMEGKDIIARAKTGTGKTLSFVLPILEKLRRHDSLLGSAEEPQHHRRHNQQTHGPRVLVLAPTRELARQVARVFVDVADSGKLLGDYSKGRNYPHKPAPGAYTTLLVQGGTSMEPQIRALTFTPAPTVVVGTPGRVLDLTEKGFMDLSRLETFVLDEADYMLDIGFSQDIEAILTRVKEHRSRRSERSIVPLQTLLFSATLPSWIQEVAANFLRPSPDRTILDITEGGVVHAANLEELSRSTSQSGPRTARGISHVAAAVPKLKNVPTVGQEMMWDRFLFSREGRESGEWMKRVVGCIPWAVERYAMPAGNTGPGRTIIFTERKIYVDLIVEALQYHYAKHGDGKNEIVAKGLHGDIRQNTRDSIMQGFRQGKVHIMVATDVAARGLDIPATNLVLQTHPPRDTDSFVHRSGRTARAGATGTSLVFYDPDHIKSFAKSATDPSVEPTDLLRLEKEAGMHFERRVAHDVPASIVTGRVSYTPCVVKGLDAQTLGRLVHMPMFARALETALPGSTGPTQVNPATEVVESVRDVVIVSPNVDTEGEALPEIKAAVFDVPTNTFDVFVAALQPLLPGSASVETIDGNVIPENWQLQGPKSFKSDQRQDWRNNRNRGYGYTSQQGFGQRRFEMGMGHARHQGGRFGNPRDNFPGERSDFGRERRGFPAERNRSWGPEKSERNDWREFASGRMDRGRSEERGYRDERRRTDWSPRTGGPAREPLRQDQRHSWGKGGHKQRE